MKNLMTLLTAGLLLLFSSCSKEIAEGGGASGGMKVILSTDGSTEVPGGISSFRLLAFSRADGALVKEVAVDEFADLGTVSLPVGKYVWTVIAGFDASVMSIEGDNLADCRLVIADELTASLPDLLCASSEVWVGKDKEATFSFGRIVSMIDMRYTLPESEGVTLRYTSASSRYSFATGEWSAADRCTFELAATAYDGDGAGFRNLAIVTPSAARSEMEVVIRQDGGELQPKTFTLDSLPPNRTLVTDFNASKAEASVSVSGSKVTEWSSEGASLVGDNAQLKIMLSLKNSEGVIDPAAVTAANLSVVTDAGSETEIVCEALYRNGLLVFTPELGRLEPGLWRLSKIELVAGSQAVELGTYRFLSVGKQMELVADMKLGGLGGGTAESPYEVCDARTLGNYMAYLSDNPNVKKMCAFDMAPVRMNLEMADVADVPVPACDGARVYVTVEGRPEEYVAPAAVELTGGDKVGLDTDVSALPIGKWMLSRIEFWNGEAPAGDASIEIYGRKLEEQTLTASLKFGGIGDGQSVPYEVCSPARFDALRNFLMTSEENVRAGNYTRSKYVQVCDIDLAPHLSRYYDRASGTFKTNTSRKEPYLGHETSGWLPLGTTTASSIAPGSNYRFCGEYDGRGFTIDGVYIDSGSDNKALFGSVEESVFRNVVIGSNSYVTGNGNVAALAFAALGTNEFVECVNHADVECNRGPVGGIVGVVMGLPSETAPDNGSFYTRVEKCVNYGAITNLYTSATSTLGTGGIAGYLSYYTRLVGCENRGTISSQASHTGGIAGNVINNNFVHRCMNYGKVTGAYDRCGGILGSLQKSSQVIECGNYADISGGACTGGIVGQCYAASATQSAFIACYNEGTVSGTNAIKTSTSGGTMGTGGIVGSQKSTDVIICLNAGDVSGVDIVGGISGWTDANSDRIHHCVATGRVTVTAGNADPAGNVCRGGMLGISRTGTTTTVTSGTYSMLKNSFYLKLDPVSEWPQVGIGGWTNKAYDAIQWSDCQHEENKVWGDNGAKPRTEKQMSDHTVGKSYLLYTLNNGNSGGIANPNSKSVPEELWTSDMSVPWRGNVQADGYPRLWWMKDAGTVSGL